MYIADICTELPEKLLDVFLTLWIFHYVLTDLNSASFLRFQLCTLYIFQSYF